MNLSIIELPRPNLGDLSDLRATSIKMRRQKSPNVLGYSYHELCKLDTIKVELVPEKKGLILKHVEYEVTSQVSWSIFFGYEVTSYKALKKKTKVVCLG